jgi:predicted  nucleic acid-binding Zn-ribbon protein
LIEQDRLRSEIDRLTTLHAETSDSLAKAREEIAVTKSAVVPIQFEVERTKKEKDVLKNHSEFLDAEVRRATYTSHLVYIMNSTANTSFGNS